VSIHRRIETYNGGTNFVRIDVSLDDAVVINKQCPVSYDCRKVYNNLTCYFSTCVTPPILGYLQSTNLLMPLFQINYPKRAIQRMSEYKTQAHNRSCYVIVNEECQTVRLVINSSIQRSCDTFLIMFLLSRYKT